MTPPSTPRDPYRPAASVNEPPGAGGSGVPPSVVALLAATRPWVKLLVILYAIGLAFSGFAVVVSLVAGRRDATFTSVIPLAIGMVLYLVPVTLLWRFAGGVKRLEEGGGLPALEDALSSQKSFWKYLGIIAVAMVAALFLIAVGSVIVGFMSARARRTPTSQELLRLDRQVAVEGSRGQPLGEGVRHHSTVTEYPNPSVTGAETSARLTDYGAAGQGISSAPNARSSSQRSRSMSSPW
jgi:hypothetical protein